MARPALPLAATAALLACAAGGTPPRQAPSAGPTDPVAVHRALLAIEAAGRRGEAEAEQRRWTAEAAARPGDPVPPFLAAAAMPPDEEAWARMKALTVEFRGSALGYVGMARVRVALGAPGEAERHLAAALAVEPDAWLALLVRASASERAGRLDQAAGDWRAVLEADPPNPEAHAGLARRALAAGDPARARAEAEAALAAAPDHAPALQTLGDAARAAGDPAGAAAAYGRAALASPSDRALRAALASALGEAGDLPGAVAEWRAAAGLGEDAAILASLAGAARAAGDSAAEADALERLGRLRPTAPALARLGSLRLAAGDAAAAEDAYRRALALDPGDADARLGLGRALLARGSVQQALGALRAAGEAGRAEREALEASLNVRRVAARDAASLERAVGTLLEATLHERRAGSPALAGTLELRVSVDAAGAATLVEVLADTVRDEHVRACAYWNLRDASYPKKAGRHAFRFALPPPQ